MTKLEPDKRLLRRRLGKWGPELVKRLLTLQEADMRGKGHPFTEGDYFLKIRTLIEEVLCEDACLTLKDLHITGNDLIAAGFPPGPELGKCLAMLLRKVQDEEIPNEKEALLCAAKNQLSQNSPFV